MTLMTNRPRFRWQSAALTDVGTVRALNEDAILDRADTGFWVVADGMGGHSLGDVASSRIVEAFTAYKPQILSIEAVRADIDRILHTTNADLVALAAAQTEKKVIGSTVVLLAVVESEALVAWAGDSRAYRLRGGQLEQISTDHSYVQSLVDGGVIESSEAESHPYANVVTRAVGADETLDIEIRRERAQDNDVYLLCSDGLTKVISDDEIAEALKLRTCHDSANLLMSQALASGARDNVSVIVVRVEEATLDS